jgi:hypothetical protein
MFVECTVDPVAKQLRLECAILNIPFSSDPDNRNIIEIKDEEKGQAVVDLMNTRLNGTHCKILEIV